MADVALERATGDDLAAVVALLSDADLPTADVRDGDAAFYLGRDGDRPVGVAGLEPCDGDALLRSVVVDPAVRGEGYGRALVAAVADRARERDAGRLSLLTTTAADFFASEGFERVDREAVPAAVRATAEFAALCPDSATCMARAP